MTLSTDRAALKQQYLDQAVKIFQGNLQQGHSRWKNMDYRFIAPATTEYVYQWLWDTSFHAIVLSHIDPEWAKSEIKLLMHGQWEDGFLPHVIFWQDKKVLPHWAFIESKPFQLHPHTTALTQPPVVAIAIEQIHKQSPDQAFLQEVMPKILSHHRWLKANRDPDQDDLISIISPNESGMDELPVFQYAVGFMGLDPARLHYYYRRTDLLNQWFFYNNKRILSRDYFNVEEVLFNCVFAEACRSLGRLLQELGNGPDAKEMLDQALKTEQAILKKCWDTQDNIFYSLYSRQEKSARIKTAASLLPLFLDGITKTQQQHLVDHLTNQNEFWTKYPVPSVSQDEPSYEPADTPTYRGKLLFRGPTWINLNWFIIKGLQKHGYHEIAEYVIAQTLSLVKQHGFREYYNPETGQGYRRQNFGWSTLIADLL